jgi:hypothetical protein
VGTQVTYEQLALAEVQKRDATDYRFEYWTYLGWTILTFGRYADYATFRLVERRDEHAKRRLAFMSYFWHALSSRAEALGRRDEVAEGLDNMSRTYQQVEAFERRNKREPVLWMLFRLALPFVGAYVNHFLNKDLIFFDEWETSYNANAEWVMQRLGYPVAVPKRTRPVRDRSTGLSVLLVIITAGIYAPFWRAQTMADGNGHFDDDAAAEDALLRAMGVQPSAPGAPPDPMARPPATPGA